MKSLSFNQRGQAFCLLRGYKTLGNLIDLNSSLGFILNLISSSDPYVYEDGYEIKVEDVLAKTRKSFEKFYKVRNVTACKSDDADELDDLAAFLIARAQDDETFEAFYDVLNEKVTKVNPFDVPVTFVDDFIPYGEVNSTFIGLPVETEIMKTKECYISVYLSGKSNDELSTVYGHEVTHMITPRGGCLNAQNSEVLSIFNEKLFALDIDPSGELLTRVNRFRNKALFESAFRLYNADDHSPYERFKDSIYITSTLLATHLFDMYLEGNDDTKDRIISGIQGVFDGRCTVEDVLSSKNMTYENSCNPLMYSRHV